MALGSPDDSRAASLTQRVAALEAQARGERSRFEAQILLQAEEIAQLRAGMTRAAVRSSRGEPFGRRDLLKTAGAAVLGTAAGLAAAPAMTAQAATNGNMILGQPNDANAPTTLNPTGQISPFAGNPATFGALFQATGGTEGIDGYGPGSTGYGLLGSSDSGFGVVGVSGTGVDMYCRGTGRLLQTPNLVKGPPAFLAMLAEQVRDQDGALWVSNPDQSWRRVNSIIPITPIRVLDTRNPGGIGTVGGQLVPGDVGGAQSANAVITLTLAGQVGIPGNALGIVGNLTSVYPSMNGFLTIFPADGTTGPSSSNVNYVSGGPPTPNACTVGLGSGANAGKVSIHVSNNPPGNVHILLDIFGYIQ